MVDQACVLQLEPGGGKLEFTNIYVSENWAGLASLLSQPKNTVSGYKVQFSGTAPSFVLEEPTRVLIQGANSEAQVQMMAEAFRVKVPKGAENLEKAIATVTTRLTNGGFIAEFANNTHTLCVRYLPASRDPITTQNPGLFSPAGRVTAQTFLMATETKGNLHFDIVGNNIVTAQFAMDYLRDRAGLVNSCLDSRYSEDVSGSKLVPVNSALNPVKGTPRQPPRSFTASAELPTVMIEDMTGGTDTPPDGCVCVDIDVTATDDGQGNVTYDLGTLVLKLYEGPCPPTPPEGGGGDGG